MNQNAIVCPFCFHHCRLSPGSTGFCRTRMNKEGQLVSLNYGQLTSLALDPIEKKPLARFHPGSFILSVGSFGCNLRCPFCQNYSISQHGEEAVQLTLTPEELTRLALKTKETDGNIGVAFTYNEPLLSFEYIMDTAKLLKEHGLLVVIVTNGCLTPEYFNQLLPLTDAMNIDLKGFTEEFYHWVGGDLKTVMANIESAVRAGVHVEVTTLVIPNHNDSLEDMKREAQWLASISPQIPLHISRYFPMWKCTEPPTPIRRLMELEQTAKEHLEFVYRGNW
jgi:pyruvate formate lyase activating enzyme